MFTRTQQDALRWSRFKQLAPEQMFETVRDKVFPFIKSLGETGRTDEGSTYTHHMQGRALHDAHGSGAGQCGRPAR